MKVLHFTDIPFNLPYQILVNKPDSLAKQIFDKHLVAELFLININYHTDNISRADNAGILLLKYLRLYNLRQHCVLYSFLSREQLLSMDPSNLIIFSEGVTFIRMPENLENLNFQSLAKENAPDDLSAFFKVDFRLPEEGRHDWANWWGIERLWQVHQAVINKKKEDIDAYSNSFFIQKTQSIEALKALYLYPVKKDSIKQAIRNDEINRLNNDIVVKKNLVTRIKAKKYKTPEDLYDIQKYEVIIKENSQKIITIQNRKSDGDEIRVQQTIIANSKKKIVLIDDQAEDGWATVFKNILFGDNVSLYSNLTVPQIDDNNTFMQFINEDTDIVLLDLRLKKEPGSHHDISNLSGVSVLKTIVERFPGLPVIMITASNKFNSYKTVMDLGADAYWVKEGLDSRYNETESFDNYKHFLILIEKLSGREYKLLKYFSKHVNDLKKLSNPWWASHTWQKPDYTNSISLQKNEGKYLSDITKILDYAIMLYRNWLKSFILSSLEKTDQNEEGSYAQKMLANIINTLGGIVEIIHIKYEGRTCSLAEIGVLFGKSENERNIRNRGDFMAFYIYCMRNVGSHFTLIQNIDFEFFEFYIKTLITWLTIPYNEIEINDLGINDYKEFVKLYDLKEIISKCENMILLRQNGIYKYEQYANFYTTHFG